MKEVYDFIKKNFQQPHNGLLQIIILNGMVFMALLLIKAFFVLAGYRTYYQVLVQYLVLPSLWDHVWHQPWTLLTYSFIHEQLFAMLLNMLLLYTFGKVLANFLGAQKLVTLYTLASLVGGLAFVGLYQIAPTLQGTATYLAGASIGVYAVVVGTATFAPNFSLRLLWLGGIKMKYIVLGLLLFSMIEFSNHKFPESVAQGLGALLGYLYIQQLQQGVIRRQDFRQFCTWLKKPFTKQRIHMKVTQGTREAVQHPASSGVPQKEIDRILDKIAQKGYRSLTSIEKEKLFQAGQ